MAIDIVIKGDYNDRDIKRLQRDLDLLKTQSGTVGTAFSKMSAIGVGMGAAVGAAAIQAAAAGARMALEFGVNGVKAFIADDAAAARLAKTLANLGLEGATAAVEANIDSLQRAAGIADDVLRPAFGRLVTSTGNVAEANRLLALATDISAGTGRDLNSVVMGLARAADGSTAGLSRLGTGLSKATLATGDMDVITKQLAETFGGQALVKAATFQGQIDRVAIAFGELQESFGRGFMAGVEAGFNNGRNAGDQLATTIQNLEPTFFDLGVTIGGVVQYIPNIVAGFKVVINGATVLRESLFLVVKALIAVSQASSGNFSGAAKTITDGVDRVKLSFGAMLEAGANVAGMTFHPLEVALARSVKEAERAGVALGGGGGGKDTSVATGAAAAAEKVYKYAEAIKAAQKATDDGVKSFNDYALSVSGSIIGLLSIDHAATLFQDRNEAVKTALKELTDYQATLSAEQTDAEKKKVTELQAIYQAAQTQAAEGGASIVDTFVQQAAKVSEFGTKMRQLLAAGLNETSFREIAAMNLENGTRVADAFLDGNIQENIRRANEAVGSVKSIADQVGLDAAKQFATAGINMAVAMIEALLDVIGSKGKGRKALLLMMDDLAAAMNRTSYINVVTTSSGQGGGVQPGSTPAMSPVEASNLADFLAGGIGSPVGGFFPGFANGGPVMGGRPIVVGERGPELFVPNSSGNVVPNGGMGGNTYSITVQAGVGDPRTIGQQVVEYITKFEQANGKVFVSA